MNKKESKFDFGFLLSVVGTILLIAIPLFFLFSYDGGEPCDRDCEYYRDNQPDLEIDPIDLNGDGVITRDEAEY